MSLLDQYREMHEAGHFPGHSTEKWSDDIKALIDKHKAEALLDYGSGKGMQYYKRRLHADWGVEMPALYDPAVPGLDDRSIVKKSYDGVICTDVLEHLEGHQLQMAIKDCLDCARRFVLFSITCRPAKKLLPDGRNCHITVQPPTWWRGYIQACRDADFTLGSLEVVLRFEE